MVKGQQCWDGVSKVGGGGRSDGTGVCRALQARAAHSGARGATEELNRRPVGLDLFLIIRKLTKRR